MSAPAPAADAAAAAGAAIVIRNVSKSFGPVNAVSELSLTIPRGTIYGFIDFITPADGIYTLKLSDFMYRGGDDYFYRLTLSTGPRIDFALPAAGLAKPGDTVVSVLGGDTAPGATHSVRIATLGAEP